MFVQKINLLLTPVFCDLSFISKEHNIPYEHVNSINDPSVVAWVRELKPDVIFCLGWPELFKKNILSIPAKGVIGYHPAKLPNNRGRHPLIWALALGLKKSASTFFLMDETADTGDIIDQVDFDILYEDDAFSLYKKVIGLAHIQLKRIVDSLINNTLVFVKQELSECNVWRKRGPNDGLIDFRMSSFAIYKLVNALRKPYVGAHVFYKDGFVKVWKVDETTLMDINSEPGKVLAVINNIISVKSYDKIINILEHEFTELPKVGDYL